MSPSVSGGFVSGPWLGIGWAHVMVMGAKLKAQALTGLHLALNNGGRPRVRSGTGGASAVA